jgi:hypothetical protein
MTKKTYKPVGRPKTGQKKKLIKGQSKLPWIQKAQTNTTRSIRKTSPDSDESYPIDSSFLSQTKMIIQIPF